MRILNQIVQEVQTEPQHIPECPFNLNRNTSEPPSENSDDYLDDSEVKASETFVPENIKSKYFQNSEWTFLTILQSYRFLSRQQVDIGEQYSGSQAQTRRGTFQGTSFKISFKI